MEPAAEPPTAPAPPPGFEIIRGDVGFTDFVGPMYVRKPRDGQTLAWGFRADSRHVNRGGVVHGGMLVTFADHSLGALVFFAAGKKPCSTVDLSCSFVAPAREGDWIECRGEIVRRTSSLIFMHGRVYCEGRTLLDAKGIWKILDRWLGPEQTAPR